MEPRTTKTHHQVIVIILLAENMSKANTTVPRKDAQIRLVTKCYHAVLGKKEITPNDRWKYDYQVSGFLNYVMIYECYWSDLKPLVWICFILWLLFLLYMLANTADAFFCPSLEVIVDILRVSPDIAGVTFLSFGNGAPGTGTFLTC